MAAPKKSRPRSGNPAVRSGSVAPPEPTASRPKSSPPARKRVTTKPTVAVATPAPVDDLRALPPDGAAYPQILRGGTYVWWRSVLGVVFGLSLFLLLTRVVSQLAIFIIWAIAAADRSYADYNAESYAYQRPTGLLAVNLGIITLIPISVALMLVVHLVRPHWLLSVQPGIRWRYLIGCLVVALVALNGVYLLSIQVTGPLHIAPQAHFWGFLVVIVLTSPIQAAAEEIFFRGYLMQALGSLVARPWFGVVISSVVFALLHGTQNLPLFVDRLAFGLLAALLVWRTGGLEAGIAAHTINNVFAFLIASLTSSIATLQATRSVTWLNTVFDVGGFAVFALLAYGLSRLMKLRTRVDLAARA